MFAVFQCFIGIIWKTWDVVFGLCADFLYILRKGMANLQKSCKIVQQRPKIYSIKRTENKNAINYFVIVEFSDQFALKWNIILKRANGYKKDKVSWIFSVCAPPPPQYVMRPQLQSTCHYIVNYYVKLLHVRLGGANNMRPLSWAGTNGKDPVSLFHHNENWKKLKN